MTRFRFTPLVLVAAVAVATAAPAQAQPRASVLTGRVVADVTTRALADAEVSIASLKRVARTDSSGLFAMDGLPAGSHAIVVRHVGFEPLEVTIEFTGADTLARMFVLDKLTRVVSAGTPHDSSDKSLDKYLDFRRRRARGLGQFLVREDIGEPYDRPLSDVLRRFPGMILQRSARNPGVAVASRRGVPSQGSLSAGDGFPPMCYMQVYIDGVRIFAAGHGQVPVNINDWRTDDIEAIEFYSSPDQTPPELGGAGAICGTIGLWLRLQ